MKQNQNKFAFYSFCLIICMFLNTGYISQKTEVTISVDIGNPKILFAVDELKASFIEKGIKVHINKSTDADIIFSLQPENSALKTEGFSIKRESDRIYIISADDAGSMYGGLELAEQIRLFGLTGVKETLQNPYMEVRGTKFNIPLDVRTPSYTDCSAVAQFNIPVVWDFQFWQEYIDNLARNRYNLISLWSLHPFPSMVKVPEYPDVALDDVQRSTVKWKEYYDRNGWGFDAPEILANPEIVMKISIDEKIALWQKVMRYAKDRNISFYIITWNIFVNGTDGKYGITDKIDNPVTQDYMRKTVKQMFSTYPDLAGIGLTTGENMPKHTSAQKEEWAFITFGLGILDAVKENPDRKFTLIHRQHQTGAQEIAGTFAPVIENKNIDFLFSFKYSQAHSLSSTRQVLHLKYLEDIKGMKTLWTLRNDDNYYFRWGAPGFVREFIMNMPVNETKGFYYGSDQYVWGRDFLTLEPDDPGGLEIEKHWYHWMIWGRLGYNPELGNDRFVQLIEDRFPGVQAEKLFEAWQEASMIYPKTTGFHWGALDFQWYIEACKSAPVFSQTESGFHDVNRFISLPPHPGTGYQSIPDYVKAVISDKNSSKLTPLEISRQIHAHSDKALQLTAQLKPGDNKELSNTLDDIRSMAWLGKYYAHKIHGATALALFRETGEKKHQTKAVGQLTEALGFWVKYYQNAMKQYKNPLWTNRVGYVDWVKLTGEVKKDIEIAKGEMKTSQIVTAINIPELSIVTDSSPGTSVSYGLTKLTDALTSKKVSFEKVGSVKEAHGKSIIVAGLSSGDGAASQMLRAENHVLPKVAEALSIRKTSLEKKTVWLISGFDDRGLMYALLDVADRIGWSNNSENPLSEVKEITEKPDVPERAISLYTMNRAYWESRFYDETYWARYLDMLAQNRFNSMVVIFGYENGGFLAPCYPYFFDTEEFPDVKMTGITPEEQQRNLDALNKLIGMAHERGIKFSVGIWDHIYRGGVQSGGIAEMRDVPLKPVHGLVWGVNDTNLVAYNKTALAKFVKLVPGLDGIQFRMHNESGLKKSEQDSFWADVFKTMKVASPNLRLDLRAKELPESVIQSAISTGINFRITTKYWMEQMGMPWHPTQINPEKSERRHSYAALLSYPQHYKMHWRMWNGGTTRVLLWGDPEYVRRFAGSSHLYGGEGYEVNEPLATKMEAQPHDTTPFDLLKPQYRYYDYEFERYWHFFQVFGRMGYNPQTSADVWQNEFRSRFGAKAAPLIEMAIHKASWILPRIVASCYPYRGFPTTRGWAEKQRLGDLPSYAKNEGSDLRQFANFDEEAKLLIEGGETAKYLPSMNSRWFEQVSDEITELIVQAENAIGNNQNKEFNSTVTDLKILAGLAMYHSRRIPAAISYNLFERTNDVSVLDDAIAHERKAIESWRQMVTAAGDFYAGDLMMGVRTADLCGHWKDELFALEKGLKTLEQKRAEIKPEGRIAKAPRYRAAATSTNEHLFKIYHQPVTTAEVGRPITISIKVSAASGVKGVRLLYRNVNQEMEYQTLPMLPSGEENNYQTVIPVEQINPKWDVMYFIEVMDNNGKGLIYPDFNKETPYRIIKLLR